MAGNFGGLVRLSHCNVSLGYCCNSIGKVKIAFCLQPEVIFLNRQVLLPAHAAPFMRVF